MAAFWRSQDLPAVLLHALTSIILIHVENAKCPQKIISRNEIFGAPVDSLQFYNPL
jgi:hypothetical protein